MQLQTQVNVLIERKAKKLDDAFDKIATTVEQETGDALQVVEQKNFYCFMKLYDKKQSKEQIEAYFKVLDDGNKKILSKHFFLS